MAASLHNTFLPLRLRSNLSARVIPHTSRTRAVPTGATFTPHAWSHSGPSLNFQVNKMLTRRYVDVRFERRPH